MTELIDFVACDDVRFEQGGKLTLVGVYPDSVIVTPVQAEQTPVLAKVVLFIRMRFDEVLVPDEFGFRCLMNGQPVFTTGGPANVSNAARPVSFLVNCGPLPIAKSGVLDFELTLLKSHEVLETLHPEGIPVSIGVPPTPPAA